MNILRKIKAADLIVPTCKNAKGIIELFEQICTGIKSFSHIHSPKIVYYYNGEIIYFTYYKDENRLCASKNNIWFKLDDFNITTSSDKNAIVKYFATKFMQITPTVINFTYDKTIELG